MAIPISNVTRRVVYEADGTGPYAFTFEILANTDIAVYKDDALLTLTTDYTVTIASNGTGSITLVASPTGADQIAIVGNRTIQRTTDFVTGGDFFANTVNDEMDQQTIFAQQNAEGLTRALQAPQTDPTTIDMTLPRASVRANKTLAFDTDGNPTTGEAIGDNRGNWASGTVYNKRDIVKDTSNGNIYYANTSHTSRNSQPISTNADSAKWDLLVDNASAGAAQAAAEAAQDAAETAEANAETAETNAETAATAAASSASAASSSASAASTSATNAASSASAASSSASTASTKASEASTSATNAASSASSASTSASNASSSASSASTSASNASTSATNAASSATTATTKASEASTSATNAASSATASASSATAAAASAAAAAASFDAFDDIYLGAKSSDPSVDNDGNALTTGDQYFNTTANELRVYNGSTWQAASTVGGTVTSLSVTGATTLGQNLAFTGTGNRITGDFSNATVANRALVQSSTTNGSTSLAFIPNGTSQFSSVALYASSSDPANTSFADLSISGSGNFARIRSSATGTGTTQPIIFDIGNSERMRIDTSGNVGIGTSSPSVRLQYSGAFDAGVAGRFPSAMGSGSYGGGIGFLDSAVAGLYTQDNGGSLMFFTGQTGSDTAASKVKMKIDSSGNVGIGTSSPSTYVSNGGLAILGTFGTSSKALTIYNNSGASASNVARIDFKLNNTFSNGSTSAAIYGMNPNAAGNNGGALVFATSSDGTDTNPSERARINSSGSFLVGTTTESARCTVQANSGTSDVYAAITTATLTGYLYNSASTSQSNFAYMIKNNANVGSIVCTTSSTTYATSSDYRLKHDIQPMTGALDKVAALKPVTYKWNADNSQSQGFIAHELQAVVPEAVVGEKDAVDAEGKPQYQGIDTSFLVATLTAAIQEQQAIILAQQTALTALTARVAALESN